MTTNGLDLTNKLRQNKVTVVLGAQWGKFYNLKN